mgnify:CR=1 FL=1
MGFSEGGVAAVTFEATNEQQHVRARISEGWTCNTPWPEVDKSARVRDMVTLVVQVNGKLRAKLELPPGADRDTALEQALAVENIQRHVGEKTVRKVIHVPDRLLNLVVG